MATTLTSIIPTPELFGFTGLPNPLQEQSVIPRQEVLFNVVDETVTVAAAGEDQSVDILCLLPVNFAYALSGIFMSITGTDAAAWDPVSLAIWTDGDAINRKLVATIGGLSLGTCSNPSTSFGPLARAYNFEPLPQVLLLPRDEQRLRVKVGNVSIDGAAMKVNFMARMLMYDISQAHHHAVNTPIPVR